MGENFGKVLIGIGGLIVLIGIVFVFQDRLPFLRHLGRLPGDFHVKRENVQFYFPLTTGLLLSLVLSLILWILRSGGSR